MNDFFNLDCMEGMKQFPDKFFDLAIVDPPYGIGVQSMTFTSHERKYGHMAAERRDYRKLQQWDIKQKKNISLNYFGYQGIRLFGGQLFF